MPVTTHDSVVKSIADDLDQSWDDVWADNLSGYADPAERGNHVPDIVAADEGNKLLIEVETDTNEGKDQRSAFKSYARGRSDRRYVGIIAQSTSQWDVFEEVDWNE